MTALFIDVSHHDRDRRGAPLDWGAIFGAGLGTVMMARASYGDPAGFNPTTRYFAEIQAGAKAAGYTVRGGYHNLIHGDTASIARQVDYLRRELDANSAHWAMADIEPYQELRDNGLWPRWADCLRLRDRWAQVETRVMVGYIGKWVWRDWLGSPDLREWPWPIINANYPGSDGTAQQIYTAAGGNTGPGWTGYGNHTPDIWQFTSTANVPGATANTDTNAYRGTLAQLRTLLTGDDMAFTEAQMRAFPWQYSGGGLDTGSALSALNDIWHATRVLGGLPADLTARLDAILAAAKDDTDVTVQFSPEAMLELTAIRDAVAAVPAAVVGEEAARLAQPHQP